MKATLNLNRPKKPIEIRLSTIKTVTTIIIVTIINLAAVVWGASAYKTTNDIEFRNVKEDVSNMKVLLPKMNDRISKIDGKIDTIITVLRE